MFAVAEAISNAPGRRAATLRQSAVTSASASPGGTTKTTSGGVWSEGAAGRGGTGTGRPPAGKIRRRQNTAPARGCDPREPPCDGPPGTADGIGEDHGADTRERAAPDVLHPVAHPRQEARFDEEIPDPAVAENGVRSHEHLAAKLRGDGLPERFRERPEVLRRLHDEEERPVAVAGWRTGRGGEEDRLEDGA